MTSDADAGVCRALVPSAVADGRISCWGVAGPPASPHTGLRAERGERRPPADVGDGGDAGGGRADTQ